MKRFILLLAVFVAALSLLASTASASRTIASGTVASNACDTGHVSFAKTKFAIHLGLAVGAFQRYIYKPYRAGAFKSGAPGRTKALVKAGASGLFIVHELKIACQDANSSHTLRHLLTPLSFVITQVGVLATKLKSGHFSPTDLTGAETAITGLSG